MLRHTLWSTLALDKVVSKVDLLQNCQIISQSGQIYFQKGGISLTNSSFFKQCCTTTKNDECSNISREESGPPGYPLAVSCFQGRTQPIDQTAPFSSGNLLKVLYHILNSGRHTSPRPPHQF